MLFRKKNIELVTLHIKNKYFDNLIKKLDKKITKTTVFLKKCVASSTIFEYNNIAIQNN